MNLVQAIASTRESLVAVFRYRQTRPEVTKKGKTRAAEFSIGWGSGFCIVSDRYVVTAHHVLNGGKPRDPLDKFLAFVVPGNGDKAHHFPVIAFPVERPDLDLAVVELGPCATPGIRLPHVPVSFSARQDGTHVFTLGFPAPEVAGLNVDAMGNYRGGQFFLKSHANEGIVAAHYSLGPIPVYEFNVGWHHGESGGPVIGADEPLAAFTIMQQYRNIKTPHGTVAGPHRGCALSAIGDDLRRLGATIV